MRNKEITLLEQEIHINKYTFIFRKKRKYLHNFSIAVFCIDRAENSFVWYNNYVFAPFLHSSSSGNEDFCLFL